MFLGHPQKGKSGLSDDKVTLFTSCKAYKTYINIKRTHCTRERKGVSMPDFWRINKKLGPATDQHHSCGPVGRSHRPPCLPGLCSARSSQPKGLYFLACTPVLSRTQDLGQGGPGPFTPLLRSVNRSRSLLNVFTQSTETGKSLNLSPHPLAPDMVIRSPGRQSAWKVQSAQGWSQVSCFWSCVFLVSSLTLGSLSFPQGPSWVL